MPVKPRRLLDQPSGDACLRFAPGGGASGEQWFEFVPADGMGVDKLVVVKAGLVSAMALAQEANAYLNETAPWKTAKTDVARTATSLYVALCVIDALKIALYPYLPFSSQRIHEFLGYGGRIEDASWSASRPAVGTPLVSPEVLFPKIETASPTDE